jgi:hypothetical protein
VKTISGVRRSKSANWYWAGWPSTGGTRVSLITCPTSTPEEYTASVNGTDTARPWSSPSRSSATASAHRRSLTPGVEPGSPSQEICFSSMIRAEGKVTPSML